MVKGIMGLKEIGESIYLGNSRIFGRNKLKEFNQLKDKL